MEAETIAEEKSAAAEGAYKLETSADLDPLMERIGDAKYVLLGEASHGTHEYYTWRSAITRRLIREKGFSFIAVEGDWPDCYRVNQYVKGFAGKGKEASDVLREFRRWPTWMWANWEIASLADWLRTYNQEAEKKAGFYGLDVYSLWESMEMLNKYLRKNDPKAASLVQKAVECFDVFGGSEQMYAHYADQFSCKEEIVKLLKTMLEKAYSYNSDPEAPLNTLQNAYVMSEAEHYYSRMLSFDHSTWNIRDRHMLDTFNRVLEFHGPETKAIIWEHNTHVGDARYTTMKNEGMFNLGQLVRQQFLPHEVVLTGFGSYAGKVIAGDSWGAPMKEMEVPPGKEGSLEAYLHEEYGEDRLLIFKGEEMKERFHRVMPHRAIGVVYHPHNERGNYVPSLIDKRYDAFIYLENSTAVHPLQVQADMTEVPATYPFEF